ncbi:MAG: SIS domain-containing protein [Bdellovibrionaceae bacterium]|nr:SIS domain-containing protein [Pseudobdellovibrionaceae bacterium]
MVTPQNEVQKIFSNNKGPAEFSKAYMAYVGSVLNKLNFEKIGAFIQLLETAREKQQTVFFIGNGGSAATASHYANDIGMGTRTWDKPFRTIALTDNVAVITALGNDHGYDSIFELQLKTLMKAGDVVVAITASGNSRNILKAIAYAKDKGATTVGLTGFDGGELASMVDLNLHVPTAKGEYGPVEDAHMVIDHLVGAYLGLKVQQEVKSQI